MVGRVIPAEDVEANQSDTVVAQQLIEKKGSKHDVARTA